MAADLDDEGLALVPCACDFCGVVEEHDRLVGDELAGVKYCRHGLPDAVGRLRAGRCILERHDDLGGLRAGLFAGVEDALCDQHLPLEGLAAGFGHDHALDDVALCCAQLEAWGRCRFCCRRLDWGLRFDDRPRRHHCGRPGLVRGQRPDHDVDQGGQGGSSEQQAGDLPAQVLGAALLSCYTVRRARSDGWLACSSRRGRLIAAGGPFCYCCHCFLLSARSSGCHLRGVVREGEVAELRISDGVRCQQ